MKIVFVCAGNICRSPMAEALFKQKLQERGVSDVEVSSCGLTANPWSGAHPQLRRVIGKAFDNLNGFRSSPIDGEIVQRADILLAMKQRQVEEILSRFPTAHGKVWTLRRFAGEKGDVVDFIDTHGGNLLEWMKRCYSDIERCLNIIMDKMAGPGIDAGSRSSFLKSFIG